MKQDLRRNGEKNTQYLSVFCCEDSVDGIFSAVYDAWASRLGLDHVTVQAGANQDLQLFSRYYSVETDHGKAAKVADTIQRRMGMEDYEILYQAALSKEADKGEAIFRTIVLGLAVIKRRNITRNLQQPAIARAFALSRNVGNEAHHYRMFVRFRELDRERTGRDTFLDSVDGSRGREEPEKGVLRDVRAGEVVSEETESRISSGTFTRRDSSIMFSEIAPENQVLPMLGDHFSDRFPQVNFMIYDRTHRECLVHQAGMQWAILQGIEMDEERIHRYSLREQEYARLWKGFVSSIAIPERYNPGCQMNFMPKRFWKYMTEHQ